MNGLYLQRISLQNNLLMCVSWQTKDEGENAQTQEDVDLTDEAQSLLNQLRLCDPQYNLAGDKCVWISKASSSSKVFFAASVCVVLFTFECSKTRYNQFLMTWDRICSQALKNHQYWIQLSTQYQDPVLRSSALLIQRQVQCSVSITLLIQYTAFSTQDPLLSSSSTQVPVLS